MGFLSFLGDLADFLPIPGAGLVGDALKGAGDIGSTLGKQGQGAAAGAATQAQLQAERDRNAVALYQAQQQAQNQSGQLDLERQQFATGNRGTTAKQALIGALLGNYKPTTLPGIRPASGGLVNSLVSSPAAQAAMSTLNSQASQAQNTPLSFTGGNLVAPPSLTPLPNVGSGLSDVAQGLQIAGAASPTFQDILNRIQQQRKPLPNQTYGATDADSGYQGGY